MPIEMQALQKVQPSRSEIKRGSSMHGYQTLELTR